MIAGLILGGAVGLDRTAFGQTLLAHPLIAGLVASMLAQGGPEGLWLAASLGLLSASRIPVGETMARDWSSVAVALPFALGDRAEPWAWGLAILVAAPLAWSAGWGIQLVREIARRRRPRIAEAIRADRLGALEREQGLSLLLHAVRGVLAVALILGLFRVLLAVAGRALGDMERQSLELLWGVAPLIAVPSLLQRQLRRAPARWIGAGAALGVGLLLLRAGLR